jgi:LCP family protein required for cell wall assembly
MVWQERDRAQPTAEQVSAASLGEKPRRAVTVLLIGTDADSITPASSGGTPAISGNSDALLLVRVNPRGPVQVLNLPVELAVNLPGEQAPQRLGDLYRKGGVALTADAVRELVGLEPSRPDRYVVLPRSALRRLVSDLGGLEVSPPRTMRYEDKKQKLKIDLQGGLQRLDGRQVEHLSRFRDQWLGESGRRGNQELVISSLRERLGQPEQLLQLPEEIEALQGQVETNLSVRETLSLLAAGLDEQRPIQFSTLPLSPLNKSHGKLRQLADSGQAPLWKAP